MASSSFGCVKRLNPTWVLSFCLAHIYATMTFEELRDSPEGPILVIVLGDTWTAHALHTEPTDRDHMLLEALSEMGGIDHTVTPGLYYFNIVELGPETFVVSLDLVPDAEEFKLSFEPASED